MICTGFGCRWVKYTLTLNNPYLPPGNPCNASRYSSRVFECRRIASRCQKKVSTHERVLPYHYHVGMYPCTSHPDALDRRLTHKRGPQPRDHVCTSHPELKRKAPNMLEERRLPHKRRHQASGHISTLHSEAQKKASDMQEKVSNPLPHWYVATGCLKRCLTHKRRMTNKKRSQTRYHISTSQPDAQREVSNIQENTFTSLTYYFYVALLTRCLNKGVYET